MLPESRPMEESLNHFTDKLLLLKEGMNTEEGRRLARKRHAFLESFLKEWKEEMGADLAGERGKGR